MPDGTTPDADGPQHFVVGRDIDDVVVSGAGRLRVRLLPGGDQLVARSVLVSEDREAERSKGSTTAEAGDIAPKAQIRW